MWIFLPVTAWILLFLLFHKNNCWRSSTLLAALVWGVILAAITEFLNLFKAINFWALLFAWALTNIILVVFYIKLNGKRLERFQFNLQITLNLMVLLAGVAFIAATTGLIALVAPPNNWDSMSYHMPRVVHWIQNHSVAHYPTNYLPQLYHSPWAEFAIMHFQILSGGDRFANLVQWFSMVGSLVGVSLIAQQLGAGLPGQVLSAVFTVTLPLGILQSSNTKNDYVVTFWIVCFAYYVLGIVKSKFSWRAVLPLGTSLGLAIFSKGTAYIYVLPFSIWLGLVGLKNLGWQAFKYALALISIVLIVNLGHYTRNLALFGSPIYTGAEAYTNEVFSLPILISSILKNIGIHLYIPLGFINNNNLEQSLRRIHYYLGVDINDPRTTWIGTEFSIQSLPTFEDTAGNPIHFYLIVFAIAIFLSWSSLRKQLIVGNYLLAVSCSFLLFCLLLKWQLWHSRLHLPIFVLFSAFVGVVLSKALSERFYNYIAICLIIFSLFWVFFNESKPIFVEKNIFNTSRSEQYFTNRADLRNDYVGVVNFVKDRKCSQVGLSLPQDAWEYPLWVLLKRNGDRSLRIEQVNVKNVSAKTANNHSSDEFFPCAIISVGAVRNPVMLTEYGVFVEKWSRTSSFQSVKAFVPRDR